MIGFSFDSEESAHEVWKYVERLISNPENIALSGPGRKRKVKRTKPIVLPPKSQISHPCQFLHVTKVRFDIHSHKIKFLIPFSLQKVTAHDTPRYFSLQAFLPSAMKQRADF